MPLIIHIIRICRVILMAFTFLINTLFPDTLLKLLSLRVLVAAALFARTLAICCPRNMLFVAATSICAAFLSLYPTLTTNDITRSPWASTGKGTPSRISHPNRVISPYSHRVGLAVLPLSTASPVDELAAHVITGWMKLAARPGFRAFLHQPRLVAFAETSLLTDEWWRHWAKLVCKQRFELHLSRLTNHQKTEKNVLKVDGRSAVSAIVRLLVNIHRLYGATDMVIEPIWKTGDVPSLHLLSNHHWISHIDNSRCNFASDRIVQMRAVIF